MKSFASDITKERFIERINRLSENSKPRWGKMTVAQMLKHLTELLELAKGDVSLKSNTVVSFFLGRIFKSRIINSSKPLPKGLGNARLPPNKGFETEQYYLIDSLYKFKLKNLSRKPLPIFGKMETDEWDNFLIKQFEYHLSQFEV